MASRWKNSVPVTVLHPYVKNYLERWEMGSFDSGDENPWGTGVVYSSAQVLADEAGLSRSVVTKIVKGYAHLFVSFDTADRILSAMGANYLWHSDPDLSSIYGMVR